MRVSLSATHRLPIDPFPRVQAVCLQSEAQGLTWLEDLINGEEFKREHRKLILASGIVIESPQLDDVLTCSERAIIEDRYRRQNLQFRRGPWHEQPKPEPGIKTQQQSATPKPEKPKQPEGFITVAEIAAQLKVKPFDIRQALRNSGAVKPDFGWAFHPKEVAAIKKLVGGK